MTVHELKIALLGHDEYDKVYVPEGYLVSYLTIDSIYSRNGEVVLQSNEIEDTLEYSLRAGYILHCLEWFDEDMEVCLMECDEDNDYTFYDIDGCKHSVNPV